MSGTWSCSRVYFKHHSKGDVQFPVSSAFILLLIASRSLPQCSQDWDLVLRVGAVGA